MRKYLFGWGVVTAAYYLTLFVAARTYIAITGIPIDHERHISGFVLGTVMLIVPYVIGGLYAAREFPRSSRDAFWVSVVPAVGEKVCVFLIGALFVAGGGAGGGNGIVTWDSVIMFITAEALPYFTPLYMAASVISPLVCILTAQVCDHRRKVKLDSGPDE
jgi:hypothetical protein